MATIAKTFHFAASHMLTNLRAGHKCMNMHGHNYEVEVQLMGPVETKTGMVFDYGDLKDVEEWIDTHLDHSHISCTKEESEIVKSCSLQILKSRKDDSSEYTSKTYVLDRPATAENIATEIYRQTKKLCPLVSSVMVRETRDTWAVSLD